MTADHIAFHAAERPDAIALVDNGRALTYAEFSRDIRKFTRAVHEFGLPRGATLAIDCDDNYFNWLLRLACEELGLVTATFIVPEGRGSQLLLRDFDLVLSGKDIPADSAKRHHRITSQWLQGILARADVGPVPKPAKGPDDPLRIKHTSGTTGTPKKVLYSRRIHEGLITKTMWIAGFTRRSRYLLALPRTVPGPAGCIRAGGTVIFEDPMSVGQAIATHAITHTSLAAIQLKKILDELPANFAKPPELTILSSGAAIPGVLRDRALARLATDVCDIYGCNEAGYISSTQGHAEFGSVWPGVQIEVVDERDHPVPQGEIGRIRIKSDCMVQGYLDDPETTGRVFRDGWFYAGDLGILRDAHRLQVIGRSDDVLNIGGLKISPSALEDLILRGAEVGDVGVCSIRNADGVEEICVVASNPGGSDQKLREQILRVFRNAQIGGFHVITMDRIPRNTNGKIQRDILKSAAAKSIHARYFAAGR